MSVYHDKSAARNKSDTNYGVCGRVALLPKNDPTKNFYFDNYFTSIELQKKIKTMGHDATGTQRKNSTETCLLSSPKIFMKLLIKEHISDTESQITTAKWHNNGMVTIASSEYGLSPLGKAECYDASHKRLIKVPVPNAIHQYRENGWSRQAKSRYCTPWFLQLGKKCYFLIISYLISVSKQCLGFSKGKAGILLAFLLVHMFSIASYVFICIRDTCF